MNRNPNLGLYAVAVAVGVVGALWAGVPVGSLVVLAVALACPLMMLLMMSGMHDDERRRGDRDSQHHH